MDVITTTLKIYKTATAIRVGCSEDGLLSNGVPIGNRMRTFYEYKFDNRTNKFVVAYKYLHYDRLHRELYLPVSFLSDFISWIGSYPYEIVEVPPVESVNTDFALADGVSLRDYQEPLVSFLADKTKRYKALSAFAGSGKMNPHSTKIRVPNGWTTMGDIKVGDSVVTPSGEVATVSGKFPQGKQKIWTVYFEDGRTSDCGAEHLWNIYYSDLDINDRVTLSTSAVQMTMLMGRECYIDMVREESLEASPHIKLSVHPYVAGVEISRHGEHIPEIYHQASWKQRLDLLRGLLDNGGSVNTVDSSISYTTTNETLMTGVRRLVWSLGGKAFLHQEDDTYTITIHLRNPTDAMRSSSEQQQLSDMDTLTHTDDFMLRIVDIVCNDDRQEECSCIMVDHPDHLYIVDDYIVTHNTVCSVATASRIGKPTLIITSGLLSQWWKEILSKSTLKKHEIWFIQGADSLKKLFEAKEEYKPKMIIASTRTFFMYVTRQKLPYIEFPTVDEFVKRFGIGVKIVDEAHMNFHANLTIDLLTNIEHNLYLSATFERSNKDGARIFNKVFPAEVKFGEHLQTKHARACMIGYTLGREIPDRAYLTKEGYNQALYEIHIGRDKNLRYEYYRKVLNTTIEQYYLPNRKPGQKCMFICMTTGTMKGIATHIRYKYPHLNTITFSGDDDDDLITPDVDVVVSTIKKSGTGRDIRGLKVCANLMSFKSSPLSKQVFGRLRPIPDEVPIFLDFYNANIPRHVEHAEVRRQIYMKLATRIDVATV